VALTSSRREFSVSVTETQPAQESLASLRFFEQLSKADVSYAGGKGANLGELTGAGVPVPPGFVIGAPAYAAFCDGHGLRDRIAAALEDLDPDDPEGLEEHAALTQLMLGADRDSELVSEVFDERDPAVADYLRELIPRARSLGLATSICGQAPSVYPEYTDLLVRAGIDAISVNMDVVDRTRGLIASTEQRVVLGAARSDGRMHAGHHD
jgi:phosphoenolpyruvate synthase/pyruvate phosphate dikinase